MMLVDESVDATAYLSLEELTKILEGSLSAKAQYDINSVTDIVILADIGREKEWLEQAKHEKIMNQINNHARKTPLRLILFSDFLNLSPDINYACKEGACIADFTDKSHAPGLGRTRGVCFAKTLQSTGGRLNDKGKPTQTGFFFQYFKS